MTKENYNKNRIDYVVVKLDLNDAKRKQMVERVKRKFLSHAKQKHDIISLIFY